MLRLALLLLLIAVPGVSEAAPPTRAADVMRELHDPGGEVLIAAHRGCHNPAPGHGLATTAPENSRLALERCVSLGVDIVEMDVRQSRDGNLVIIHDATVDRTTDGHGRVSDLTIAQLRQLHLRDDEGGKAIAITDQRIMTLEELLRAAGDRLVLNLDVKDASYPAVVDAVVRLGAEGRVIVKAVAGIASPPLSGAAPFDRVSFMPILSASDDAGADLAAVARRQSLGARRPLGYELPYMDPDQLPPMAREARRQGARIWLNSLFEGFVRGWGGDSVAVSKPDDVWGRMTSGGVSIIQTDYPERLALYLGDRNLRTPPAVAGLSGAPRLAPRPEGPAARAAAGSER